MSVAWLRRTGRGWLAAALLAVAHDAAAQAEGPAVNAAREHFRKAIELNEARRYPEALAEFQRAYDLSPTYRLLYNIGQLSRHVGDSPRSLRAFERYLAEGRDYIDAARRAEVEAEIAALRPRVGQVRARAEAGAIVLLDGMKIGAAPLPAPVYVNPGEHRLRAEKPGRATVSKVVRVAGGEIAEVVLAPSPAPAGEQDPPPPPPKGRATPTWIGWAATGALAAGAAVTGALALASSSELEDARYAGPAREPPPDSEVRALSGRVDALAVATDVLAGAAAVSLGVTLYITLTEPPAPAPPTGSRGGAARGPTPRSRVSLRWSAQGVSLRGVF